MSVDIDFNFYHIPANTTSGAGRVHLLDTDAIEERMEEVDFDHTSLFFLLLEENKHLATGTEWCCFVLDGDIDEIFVATFKNSVHVETFIVPTHCTDLNDCYTVGRLIITNKFLALMKGEFAGGLVPFSSYDFPVSTINDRLRAGDVEGAMTNWNVCQWCKNTYSGPVEVVWIY